MIITQNLSPNRNLGRNNWIPDIIVCHITDGSFDGAVSWIKNPASNVSYHFVVARDGRLTQMVNISDTAFANGTTNLVNDSRFNGNSNLKAVRERRVNANLYTISIGFEGRFTETAGALTDFQIVCGVWLIDFIREYVFDNYGVEIRADREHIVGHSDIVPRWKPNCPGEAFPFDLILRGVNGGDAAHQNGPLSGRPPAWANASWGWATRLGITDGSSPNANPTRAQVVQMLYNFHNAR